jgi:hypothetical protein
MTGGGRASAFIHDDHLMREAVGEVWATEKVVGAKRKRQLDDEKKSCTPPQHNKPVQVLYT